MKRRAVILQPGYLPWLGFFDLADKADVFVLLDDVQFTVRDWRTRNRVRTDRGVAWLSVPVSLQRPYFEYEIRDVPLTHDYRWAEKHLGTLKAYYKKSRFFNEIYPLVELHLLKKYKYLIDLDTGLVMDISGYLGMQQSKFALSSELHAEPGTRKDLRLLSLLRTIRPKVDCYLSGSAAKAYLNESLFGESGIEVEWHNYRHPFYEQSLWGTKVFISHLSALDILFHHGRESIDIITGRRRITEPDSLTIISADEKAATCSRKGHD